MANENVGLNLLQGFLRGVGESQDLRLARQREERFGRQLDISANLRQQTLNLARTEAERRTTEFEQKQVVFAGLTPEEKEIAAFPSLRPSGRTEVTAAFGFPGKFEVAGELKKAGLTSTGIESAIANIPADLETRDEAFAFLKAFESTPFFENKIFGIPGRFSVTKEDIGPQFRSFLQANNFANQPAASQSAILRAFDDSLGANEVDEQGTTTRRAETREEIDFDVNDTFFQNILKEEGFKTLPGQPSGAEDVIKGRKIGDTVSRGGRNFVITGFDTDGEPFVEEQ